ncbi:RluA family pseudouridine synthase [Botrimarina sp.]|uniref:RluA family pseudouridine synthase n=1 Tax=Botrimarina sp. TaxID=2795802 RepID=UPI0032EF4CE1
MACDRLSILYEDNHLLAVEKPAGVATMGARSGEPSVLDMAKGYIKQRYDKPGAVYLGVVSRLDRPVTGVLIFARTSKAAARLTDAFRTRRVVKTYLASVVGQPPAPEGSLVHHLNKDERRRRMYATHADAPGAKRAELTYRVLLSEGGRGLLVVAPQTGRKHQIRVQLAKAGAPILGDAKYGGPAAEAAGIALHAWRLEFEHPVRRTPLVIGCDPPTDPGGGWGGWEGKRLAEALRSAATA